MLKNYVTIAFRSLLKQKGFAFINILGLAIGLASAVLIFLYIVDELRFDTVHKAPDRTYRIGAKRVMDDGNEFTITGVPEAWSTQLKEQYPDVEEASRYLWLGYPVSMAYKEADRIFLTEELLWVEPTFPNVFYFPVVQGNPEKVFELPNSIVLTQTLVGRKFSKENLADSSACLLNEAAVRNLGITPEEAIGMAVMDNEQNEMCRIIGVVRDFPYRSMHQTIGPLLISARPHPIRLYM